MGEIKEEEYNSIEEHDGEFYYVNRWTKKLSREEIIKNKKHLMINVNALKKLISEMDIEKVVEAKHHELESFRAIHREALRDYDKYVRQQIHAIRSTKDAKRKQLIQALQNYDSFIEKQLAQVKTQLENVKKNYETQLENNSGDLKLYERFEIPQEEQDGIEESSEKKENN